MMSTREGARSRVVSPFAAIAIAVVTTLGALYIVSQFLRNSVAVIAPNLTAEIGLTPLELGLLSSIYFFVFAATQLPLGVALDRFGPKRCMLVSVAFTVASRAAMLSIAAHISIISMIWRFVLRMMKMPRRGTVRRNPSCSSSVIASRIGVRDTPSDRESWRSSRRSSCGWE